MKSMLINTIPLGANCLQELEGETRETANTNGTSELFECMKDNALSHLLSIVSSNDNVMF